MAAIKYRPARAVGKPLVHALENGKPKALCGWTPTSAERRIAPATAGWRIYSSVLVNCKKCIDPKNNGGITLPDNLTKGEDHEQDHSDS